MKKHWMAFVFCLIVFLMTTNSLELVFDWIWGFR